MVSGTQAHIYNPVVGTGRLEDQEIRIILNYIVSLSQPGLPETLYQRKEVGEKEGTDTIITSEKREDRKITFQIQ